MSNGAEQQIYPMGLVGPDVPTTKSVLRQKFVMPPFSSLSARDEIWNDRKRAWIAMGLESELGRDTEVYVEIPYRKVGKTQISVFDPVLCELMYSWFCPPGGQVIDPFAGGSVRGIVASCLGLRYWGCDLSAKQVEANRAQVKDSNSGIFPPKWVIGDSYEQLATAPEADFILSCPPYGNLEVYSEDEADISNMPYDRFRKRYADIIWSACEALRDNRFAVFVVANFREPGHPRIRDLVGDTIRAFERAGLVFYNDGVLLTPMGSAGVRTSNTFERGNRKVVKVHQNWLVFAKGQPEFVND